LTREEEKIGFLRVETLEGLEGEGEGEGI